MPSLNGMLETLFLDSNRSEAGAGGIYFNELATGEGTGLLPIEIIFLWFKYYTPLVGVTPLFAVNIVDMWSPYSF